MTTRISRLVFIDTLGLARFEPTPHFGLRLGRLPRPARPRRTPVDALAAPPASTSTTYADESGSRARARSRPSSRSYTDQEHHISSSRFLWRSFGVAATPADRARADHYRHDLRLGASRLAAPLEITQTASAPLRWASCSEVIKDAADRPPIGAAWRAFFCVRLKLTALASLTEGVPSVMTSMQQHSRRRGSAARLLAANSLATTSCVRCSTG